VSGYRIGERLKVEGRLKAEGGSKVSGYWCQVSGKGKGDRLKEICVNDVKNQ